VDWDWSRTSIDRDRRSCGVAGSELRKTNTLINNALIHTPMASEPTLSDDDCPTIAQEDKIETFAGDSGNVPRKFLNVLLNSGLQAIVP
jgi:hypothetical protein